MQEAETFFRPELAGTLDLTYELPVDQEVLTLRIVGGIIGIVYGESVAPDATIWADVTGLLGLLRRQLSPDEALESGRLRVEGDPFRLLVWYPVPCTQVF